MWLSQRRFSKATVAFRSFGPLVSRRLCERIERTHVHNPMQRPRRRSAAWSHIRLCGADRNGSAAQRSSRIVAQSRGQRRIDRCSVLMQQQPRPYVQAFCRRQGERKATERAGGRKVSTADGTRVLTQGGRAEGIGSAVHSNLRQCLQWKLPRPLMRLFAICGRTAKVGCARRGE